MRFVPRYITSSSCDCETAVGRVGCWCEMAASLRVSQLEQEVSCETVVGQQGREHGR
jgi:hypothetical protein